MDKPAILIIDDETNLLRFFEYNIRDLGYDAVTGEPRGHAPAAGRKPFATVLHDIMLPDGNVQDLIAVTTRPTPTCDRRSPPLAYRPGVEARSAGRSLS